MSELTMSESSFHKQETFIKENNSNLIDLNEANHIFDLINQLNHQNSLSEVASAAVCDDHETVNQFENLNLNNKQQESNLIKENDSSCSTNSSCSSSSQFIPKSNDIELVNNNTNKKINHNFNNNNELTHQSHHVLLNNNSENLENIQPKQHAMMITTPTAKSKIPRFATLINKPQTTSTTLTNSSALKASNTNLQSSSSNSIASSYTSQTQSNSQFHHMIDYDHEQDQDHDHDHGQINYESNNNQQDNQSNNQQRCSRSVTKTASNNITNTESRIPKRGVSLSASSTLNKLRSMSVTESSTENLSLYNDNGTGKSVKYIVRHKPKPSKVKIFSQKVEIKNVSSKIGSLEKANYVPGGGNVKIESKPTNWEAKSKIGSLEKAANYTPSGGNVKIQSFQLNWNAAPKIGSLKQANYKPSGGNVRIESYKLDFKEKAKPKTDTGLIVIKDDCSDNSFSDHMELSRSQNSFTGSN